MKSLIYGVLISLIVIGSMIISDTYSSQEYTVLTKSVAPIASVSYKLPDPDIELLSSFIKSRKSSQPKEICDKIAYEIITQCRHHNLSDDIVVGIIEIESMWNVYANSKAGAKGLMQILIEDGVEIIPEQSFDIAYNIQKGIEIFKSKLQKANGDIFLALKYYVGGDKNYYKEVYKYSGRYTLFKINNSMSTTVNKIITQYKFEG